MTVAVRFRDASIALPGVGVVGPLSWEVPAEGAWALVAPMAVADEVVRLCVGAEVPESGSVEVLGLEPAALSRADLLTLRRRLGVAFRRDGLVSNLTVVNNLVVPLVYGGRCAPEQARAFALEALEEIGLAHVSGLRPSALARDARALVALARAAVHRPELLVLEDLTEGLDRADARAALDWCRGRCATMLLLTPEPSDRVSSFADGWLRSLDGSEGARA